MRTFDSLQSDFTLKPSYGSRLWTVYFLDKHNYEKCDFDWGASHVYHFDQDCTLKKWLELAQQVISWIQSQPALENVRIVPFYEAGDDFIVQCKPPYDGGYYTRMYEEFLNYGSCQPAPWFFQHLAALHEKVTECIRDLGHVELDVLPKTIHASLIKPNDQLYWCDDEGWALYYPNVDVEDIV